MTDIVKCIHCDAELSGDSRFCSSCGADVSDPASGPRSLTDVNIGDRLREVTEGSYEVKELLGRGGMAYVFLAQDLKLGRPVAIKVLPSGMSYDDRFVRRFQREARTSAQLDHANIIPIYAVESEKGIDYFVMKYVDGKSIEQILADRTLPVERCQQILWEAARGLGHAHGRGVIHRDIKPANIMIDASGHVILTDFGISKALESATQVTETGAIVGTPQYMSPEQAKGSEVDGRSDQYSLAVLGYRLLTGRLPFEADSTHTILYQHIFEDPPSIRELDPSIPEFLADALHRAMTKDREGRFRTMEEFATAVWPEHPLTAPAFVPPPLPRETDEAQAGIPGASHAAGGETTPTRKRRLGPLIGLAALVIVAVGVAIWAVAFRNPGPTPPVAVVQPAIDPPQTAVDTAVPEEVAVADSTPAAPQPQPTETPPAPQPQTPTQQRPVAPAVPQVGYLTTNAVPFGTVSIDGVDIGDTPIRRHQLAPGTYVLRITRDGYQTVVDTIAITTGNEERRRYTLTPTGQ